jgi:copper(I)-binding protein
MRPIAAFAALLLLAPAVQAAPGAACQPVVTAPWVRMTPMMPMGAGFFSISNPCRADIVVTGVASAAFGDASMHETRVDDGVSRMRPTLRLVIGPGERVDFRPGGRHLMLMSAGPGVVPGRKVRIDLLLGDGRRLPVDFDVRSAAP